MLGYSWNVETAGIWVIQVKWAGSGNRLWRTDLYWACSFHFHRLLGVGSALAVLCELNIHNLPKSTNQAGKKRTQEYRKCLFSTSSLSSILTVYLREKKGVRLAEELHYALCAPKCRISGNRGIAQGEQLMLDFMMNSGHWLQIWMAKSESGIFKSRIKITFYRF